MGPASKGCGRLVAHRPSVDSTEDLYPCRTHGEDSQDRRNSLPPATCLGLTFLNGGTREINPHLWPLGCVRTAHEPNLLASTAAAYGEGN